MARTPGTASRDRNRLPIAIGISLATVCGLLLAGHETPLPARALAAAFLALVVFEDLRRMRIPNVLTVGGLLAALVMSGANGGVAGLTAALCGAAAGFAVFFLPYLVGWLGAGDVKAMTALGALFGLPAVLPLAWWMIVSGGILAVLYLALRGQLTDLLRRWWLSLVATLARRRPVYLISRCAAGQALPFGVAMASGAMAFLTWGTPWR